MNVPQETMGLSQFSAANQTSTGFFCKSVLPNLESRVIFLHDSYSSYSSSPKVVLLLKSGGVFVGKFLYGTPGKCGIYISINGARHKNYDFTHVALDNSYLKNSKLFGLKMDTVDETNDKPFREVISWTVDEVCSWLSSNGFSADLILLFYQQHINGSQLLKMTTKTMRTKFSILPVGVRIKLLRSIGLIRRNREKVFFDIATLLDQREDNTNDETTASIRTSPQKSEAHRLTSVGHYSVDDFTYVSTRARFFIPFDQLLIAECIHSFQHGGLYKGKWLGKSVAIKLFRGKMHNTASWEMFIDMLKELRHPNVVLILGVSQYDSLTHCIVMEWMPQQCLFNLLHPFYGSKPKSHKKLLWKEIEPIQSPQGEKDRILNSYEETAKRIARMDADDIWSTAKAFTANLSNKSYYKPTIRRKIPATHTLQNDTILQVAKEIALGCIYLKQKGVLHLNLKPQNVLIDKNFNVKLADFGMPFLFDCFLVKDASFISQHIFPNQGIEEHIRSDGIEPVYNWCAPEVLRMGKRFGIDASSDVYSFGILIWELLTSFIPFEGLTAAQVQGAVGYANLKLPTICGVSSILLEIIRSCTHTDPERRITFEQVIHLIKKEQKQPIGFMAEASLLNFMNG